MRPTPNSAVYRPDLGQVVMEYTEGDTMGYIGLEVMPVFPVSLASFEYPVIPKEALMSTPDVSRSPRGTYQRDDWEYERGYYNTSEKGTEEPIDDTERKMFGEESDISADSIATLRAWNKILRSQEKRIAEKIFNPLNFAPHAVTVEWDTPATATPIDDVNDGVLAFRNQCGMLPDALVISYHTLVKLRTVDQIVDQLSATYPGLDINRINAVQLAQIFNVPRVLVGGAVRNAAGKGLDADIVDVWDKEYASLVKISTGPDLKQAGVGRTFLWTADSPQNPIVETYREEKIRSDVYRVRHNTDEALIQSRDANGVVVSNIAASCVYLFSNISR